MLWLPQFSFHDRKRYICVNIADCDNEPEVRSGPKNPDATTCNYVNLLATEQSHSSPSCDLTKKYYCFQSDGCFVMCCNVDLFLSANFCDTPFGISPSDVVSMASQANVMTIRLLFKKIYRCVIFVLLPVSVTHLSQIAYLYFRLIFCVHESTTRSEYAKHNLILIFS